MTSPQQPEPAADRSYRSPLAIVGGLLLLAFAAWIGGDALIRGEGRARWVALAALLLVVPLIAAFTFRPVVRANHDRMIVRNPFRTIELPWAAVSTVRAGYSSEVFTKGGTKYQLWSIPVSLRERKRAARLQDRAAAKSGASAPHVAEAMGADRSIAELRQLAEQCASRPTAQGEPRVRWAYEVIATSLVGLVLLVVLTTTA
ncbi:PH domain-containing protein [Streptomyces sp. NPDC045431]|uniref:PH domain-containing protein n=1 Tax=Streptomyces sp. NPDC045431 TaxID=3155613 RepID=UPI0033CC84E9